MCTNASGKRIDDVAGDQAGFAVLVAGDVAGRPVDEHAELGRLERGQLLREQGGDHAGEDIARAAGGHPRVSGRVDVIPLSVGNHAARSLEDDHQRLGERRQRRGALDSLGLNGRDG